MLGQPMSGYVTSFLFVNCTLNNLSSTSLASAPHLFSKSLNHLRHFFSPRWCLFQLFLPSHLARSEKFRDLVPVQRSIPKDYVDQFCLAFSDQFEGGFVCPQLQDLRIPDRFAQDLPAMALKFALAGGSTPNGQLKWILFNFCVEGETLVLKYGVVDEVSGLQDPCPWFLSLVSNSSRQYARRPIAEN